MGNYRRKIRASLFRWAIDIDYLGFGASSLSWKEFHYMVLCLGVREVPNGRRNPFANQRRDPGIIRVVMCIVVAQFNRAFANFLQAYNVRLNNRLVDVAL